MRFIFLVLVATILVTVATVTMAVGRDGETVYQQTCASCHDSGVARMPSRQVLEALPTGRIVSSLETGAMRVVGTFQLDGAERVAVAEYLTGTPYDTNWAASDNQCDDAAAWPAGDPFEKPHWNGWGNGLSNTRYQRPKNARLNASDVPKLELKWAFAHPGETFVESQPTVVGGRVFVGSPSGKVYALDAATGCTHWTFQASASVKSAVTIGKITDGVYGVFFGDQAGRVYSLDAATGELRWADQGDDHPSARVTGSVQIYKGRVYVPMASLEEALAMDPDYLCCVFRGSVIAYDAASGERHWKRYTISQEPTTEGKTTDGKRMVGPSGAAVWSAVTIDPARQRFYVGTGDNYSNPTSQTSDAIVAMDLNTGEMLWTYQGAAGDAWTVGCTTVPKVNCPQEDGPDVDMGASPILVKRSDGLEVLLAGQKNGVAHAIDPNASARVLWKRKVAEGGVQGGLQWGQATDGKALYASRSDSRWLSEGNITADVQLDPNAGGGLVALDLLSGEVLWEAPAVDCTGRERCSPAQPAAVTAIAGAVFSGSVSGEMRAFDSATGEEIWRHDSAREYATVNGARGTGGAIDQAGPVIVDGRVYFNSGYAKWGGNPGNVLLVFGLAE